jgi:heat shock protein 90kDa beta
LRITSLTDQQVLEGAEDFNITITAYKDEDGTAKLTIRDTGIGMTQEELTKNLVGPAPSCMLLCAEVTP